MINYKTFRFLGSTRSVSSDDLFLLNYNGSHNQYFKAIDLITLNVKSIIPQNLLTNDLLMPPDLSQIHVHIRGPITDVGNKSGRLLYLRFDICMTHRESTQQSFELNTRPISLSESRGQSELEAIKICQSHETMLIILFGFTQRSFHVISHMNHLCLLTHGRWEILCYLGR